MVHAGKLRRELVLVRLLLLHPLAIVTLDTPSRVHDAPLINHELALRDQVSARLVRHVLIDGGKDVLAIPGIRRSAGGEQNKGVEAKEAFHPRTASSG
jgi:hypothetical protein